METTKLKVGDVLISVDEKEFVYIISISENITIIHLNGNRKNYIAKRSHHYIGRLFYRYNEPVTIPEETKRIMVKWKLLN